MLALQPSLRLILVGLSAAFALADVSGVAASAERDGHQGAAALARRHHARRIRQEHAAALVDGRLAHPAKRAYDSDSAYSGMLAQILGEDFGDASDSFSPSSPYSSATAADGLDQEEGAPQDSFPSDTSTSRTRDRTRTRTRTRTGTGTGSQTRTRTRTVTASGTQTPHMYPTSSTSTISGTDAADDGVDALSQTTDTATSTTRSRHHHRPTTTSDLPQETAMTSSSSSDDDSAPDDASSTSSGSNGLLPLLGLGLGNDGTSSTAAAPSKTSGDATTMASDSQQAYPSSSSSSSSSDNDGKGNDASTTTPSTKRKGSDSSSGSPSSSSGKSDDDFYSYTPTATSSRASSQNGGLLSGLLGGSESDATDPFTASATGTSSSSSGSSRPKKHAGDQSGQDTTTDGSDTSTSTGDGNGDDSSSTTTTTTTHGGLLDGVVSGLKPTSIRHHHHHHHTTTATATPTNSSSSSNGSDDGSGDDDVSSSSTEDDDGSGLTPSVTSSYATPHPTFTGSPSQGGGGSNNGTHSGDGGSDGGPGHNNNGTHTGGGSTNGTSDTVAPGHMPTSMRTVPLPTQTSLSSSDDSDSPYDPSSIVSTTTATSTSTSTSSSSDGGEEPSHSHLHSHSDSGSSSTKSTSSDPYWYADRKSLNIPPASKTASASAGSETSTRSSSNSNGSSSDSGSSQSDSGSNSGGSGGGVSVKLYPSTIVPSDSAFTQPSNTTSIAVLFTNAMPWTWVARQADLTAQIFGLMPGLLSSSLAPQDGPNVTTVRLQQYNADKSAGVESARSLYVAYVPTAYVEELQTMIANTSSPFYVNAPEGAAKQLAEQVDPTFNILTAAGVSKAADKASSVEGATTSETTTLWQSLIGVASSLGGVTVLAVGYMAWKRQQKRKGGAGGRPSNRPMTINSFGGDGAGGGEHAGLRETWTPNATQHFDRLAVGAPMADADMVEVWRHDTVSGSGGYGRYSDEVSEVPAVMQSNSHLHNNRSSRLTERSDYSHMTEAQRIQYNYYEASQRSSSVSSPSEGGSHDSHDLMARYQDNYQAPQQFTSQHHATSASPTSLRRSPTASQRPRRRGSVASSIIGRPEMTSNSMLL